MNLSLEKEIKNYTEISRQSEVTTTKIYQFFKTYIGDSIKIIDKSKKILEEYFKELHKEPCQTTNNLSFLGFYNDIQKYITKLRDIYLSIDQNVTNKLEYLLKRMRNNHCLALKELTNLSLVMNDNKLKLEKYKNNYFNAYKIVIDQEKRIIDLSDNKNIKEETFSRNNDLLSKFTSDLENQESIYNNEIKKVNKNIESSEQEYLRIIKVFKDEYSNKLNVILNAFNDFKKDIKNIAEIHTDILPKIEKATKFVNIDKDINDFVKKNNYIGDNKKRFLLEKFLDYKNLRYSPLNDDKNIINNKSYKQLDIRDKKKFLKILNLGKIDENEDVGVENNKIKTQEEQIINEYLMNIIMDIIKYENKIDDNKYKYITEFIKKKPDNIVIVINLLLNQCIKSFMKISNIENLYLLSDLLNSIINTASKNNNIFEVCYIAIFIAEKTIYFNKDNIYNKCYLCKVLSEKPIFSDTKFWTDMIIQKINIGAEINTKMEIEKREREKNGNKNDTMMKKVKGIIGMFNFNNDKNKELEIIENEILYGQLYEEKLPLYSVEIIEEYIQHFSNFNFEQKKASQLILELAEKYKFDDSFVTYFMAKLNSNMRLNSEDLMKNKKNNFEKELKELDYNKLYFNSSNDGATIKYKRILDTKMRGLIYSLKYIEIKDFPNILALNKNYNKILIKIIYKNILIKYHDMDIQNHINIWKILLNYSDITKNYDYNKLKKELNLDNQNTSVVIEQLKDSKDIIDLDVLRTNFDVNKEENQIKVSNILKCMRKAKTNLKYCQGMNFVAAFLLNITNNEEETFYLFLSILDGTDYGNLFVKDLEKLKKYFYVFGRLMNVLLPELEFFLKDNKVDVSYFVSPWFITLFTSTLQNIKDKKNPKILLRIFDLFFFSGWKSIIKIGISLLKNYESTIMNLGFEELLRFLISNILKSDFFQKENYEQLMQIQINFKIKSSLISDIENEYEMKKKLAKFGQKFSTGIPTDN